MLDNYNSLSEKDVDENLWNWANNDRTRKNQKSTHKLTGRKGRIVETIPQYKESSGREDIEIDYEELNALLQTLEEKKLGFFKPAKGQITIDDYLFSELEEEK